MFLDDPHRSAKRYYGSLTVSQPVCSIGRVKDRELNRTEYRIEEEEVPGEKVHVLAMRDLLIHSLLLQYLLEQITTSHTVSDKETVIIFSNLNEEQKNP